MQGTRDPNPGPSDLQVTPAGLSLQVRASPAIELPRMDDWHLHLRDGRAMRVYAHASAAQCRFALVMPNLDPPVTTVAAALEYRARILAALGRMPMSGARESTDAHAETDKGADAESFTPLMTLYLTDETLPSEIEAAARTGLIPAAKLYPAGATTNSARGVTDVARLAPVLAAMERTGLVLCVHGEVTDPAVDVFDREAVFIQTVLAPLLCAHPRLRVVLEHVTSRAGVAFVDAFDSDRLAATVTPQHALLSRAALFAGGRLRPHAYCLPVYKTADDQAAVAAAAAGAVAHPHRFFAGTDSAPHRKGNKECAGGCAGCYTGPHAMQLYAEALSRPLIGAPGSIAGASDSADATGATVAQLRAFLCENGARFYGYGAGNRDSGSGREQQGRRNELRLVQVTVEEAAADAGRAAGAAVAAAMSLGTVTGGESSDDDDGAGTVPFVAGASVALRWRLEPASVSETPPAAGSRDADL